MRMAKIQNTNHTKCFRGCGATGISYSLLAEMQNGTATLEDSLAVSIRLNTLLIYDPAIILLGTYTKEVKIYGYTDTCT